MLTKQLNPIAYSSDLQHDKDSLQHHLKLPRDCRPGVGNVRSCSSGETASPIMYLPLWAITMAVQVLQCPLGLVIVPQLGGPDVAYPCTRQSLVQVVNHSYICSLYKHISSGRCECKHSQRMKVLPVCIYENRNQPWKFILDCISNRLTGSGSQTYPLPLPLQQNLPLFWWPSEAKIPDFSCMGSMWPNVTALLQFDWPKTVT